MRQSPDYLYILLIKRFDCQRVAIFSREIW